MWEVIEKLQTDPILHVESIQGVTTLESYQKDILNSVRDHDRIAIAASHDVGKTFTMAKVALWLGSTFPGTKIITTAPTWIQVEKLLWSEIRTGFAKSKYPLGGKMLNTEWKIDDDWFAFGISPKEDAGTQDGQGTDSRMQGFHAEQIVIIFDEATGISPKRWVQAEGMMTSARVKWIAIGNPTSRNSEFFRCFKDPMWHKIYLSCFDSPNLKANDIHNIQDLADEIDLLKSLNDAQKQERIKSYKIVQPKLLTLQWVIGGALKWGLSHPLFVSKGLGQFPEDDDFAIVKLADVENAQRRDAIEDPQFRSIGVDPARFGSDSTVITILEGAKQTERIELIKKDTSEVTGHVVRLLNERERKNQEVVVIDATGLGSGVVDQLKERRSQNVIASSINIREVHFGAACPDSSNAKRLKDKDRKQYANLKAKIFDLLSEDMKTDLSILNEAVYLEELPTILYKYDSRGRMVIESKDDYKARTGLGSPDSADSLALANYGRHNEKAVGSFKGMGETGNSAPDTIISSMGSGEW